MIKVTKLSIAMASQRRLPPQNLFFSPLQRYIQHCRQSSVTAIALDEDEVSYRKSTSASTSSPPPLYVSATRQHVGKTTTSMALVSGLQKRFDQVGFMKPVGQVCLEVNDGGKTVQVDKDAVLVKEHFHLNHVKYNNISPVLIPRGYTRDYLDGHISYREQEELVHRAYAETSESSDIVLCEGTGHCAVGSIVHASNAQVASWLNAKMVLVANGGLGNTFDDLELNKALCDREGVDVCGVIVNKVQPDKLEQTREYIQKAFDMHWGKDEVPLVGVIPDRPFLGCPALADFERLFQTKLLTGRQHLLRHYRVRDLSLVATSLQVFLRDMRNNPSRTLYVCHASRNDILLGFLLESPLIADRGGTKANESALIVTGTDEYPLSDQVLDIVHAMKESESSPPVMLVPQSTSLVMEQIVNYTPKLNFEDSRRASTAVEHYEPYIDFDLLLERSGHLLEQETSP
ncbi:cobyrinic acid a,c-diamide synthase [Nitzschia inconspicua]|uniref:Cobyrinic acid a,c-diamide synthase n=1 Tax=Nitzschia inconspicua TaxID=303405 RepID=A0A9K3PK42_9STRA|nr:cobyrinic acid a,c-diamide synthase [Nitzschia inconspicua]